MTRENSILATISTRNCPTCGHHEVGYVTEDGTFHSLKPGDNIRILKTERAVLVPEAPPRANGEASSQEAPLTDEIVPWIPAPLGHDRSLRLKYGVLMAARMVQANVSGSMYEQAYQEKLQDLIEKEVYVPLPVVFDRYFNSPHLAAGTPREIAEALFRELDEISGPVDRMSAWLEDPSSENLKRLISPHSTGDKAGRAPSDAELKQELASLTLEEFFDLL